MGLSLGMSESEVWLPAEEMSLEIWHWAGSALSCLGPAERYVFLGEDKMD